MKRKSSILPVVILLLSGVFLTVPAESQEEIQKEVRVFQPYKPTLSDAFKMNFLPSVTDTLEFHPLIEYSVSPKAFMPEYEIMPIGAARMLSDPLTKLYKGYVNLGLGNYLSPLAEVHIGSLRSRKSAVGLHVKHRSSHGKVKLDNDEKVFAGYGDNEAEFFYTRFMRNAKLKTSAWGDYKTRHAYGYSPFFTGTELERDSIKNTFLNAGATMNIESTSLDSSDLAYDIDLQYSFFHKDDSTSEHSIHFSADLGQEIAGFYAGGRVLFDYYDGKVYTQAGLNSLIGLHPFVEKGTPHWRVHLGGGILMDYRNGKNDIHLIPDVWFRFDVVPSYIHFRVGLDGGAEKNSVRRLYTRNRFLYLLRKDISDIPATVNKMRVHGGFMGSLSPLVTYNIQASYSLFENEVFAYNYHYSTTLPIYEGLNYGNGFNLMLDEGEVFRLDGEINTTLSDRLTIGAEAKISQYNLSNLEESWNRIPWQGEITAEYNLRDKIILDGSLVVTGPRPVLFVRENNLAMPVRNKDELETYVSANLGIEYRYSKVLSAWIKAYNISNRPWYEYQFYPSQRFLFMAGMTYSL